MSNGAKEYVDIFEGLYFDKIPNLKTFFQDFLLYPRYQLPVHKGMN